jgi:hypothetical protein
MIDILPSSIGLLLWKDDDIDINEDDKEEINKRNRYFEPILLKGDQLPTTKKQIIKLADINQKKVSLDIYEELDDITYLDDSIESNGCDINENRLINYKYRYLSFYLPIVFSIFLTNVMIIIIIANYQVMISQYQLYQMVSLNQLQL